MLTYFAQMTSASRIIAPLAWLAVLLALAAPARADMVDDCQQKRDPDLAISGCTAAIRSGEWQAKNRYGNWCRCTENAHRVCRK